jgi:hypothetical protein
VALALGWLVVTPAMALDAAQVMRPCRRGDLLGVWRVLRLGVPTGAAVDRSDPAFMPHQRYVFHSDATMAHVTQEVPFTGEEQRALPTVPRPATWALESEGRLVRQRDGVAAVETSECRVLIRAVKDPRTSQPTAQIGDLLLTERPADGRPGTRRLLRRTGKAE